MTQDTINTTDKRIFFHRIWSSITCTKRTMHNKTNPEKRTSFVELIANMEFTGKIA